MAWVKTFRINPAYGMPDKDIAAWLAICEQNAVIRVHTIYIPSLGKSDPRVTLIVTKLDELNVVQ